MPNTAYEFIVGQSLVPRSTSWYHRFIIIISYVDQGKCRMHGLEDAIK